MSPANDAPHNARIFVVELFRTVAPIAIVEASINPPDVMGMRRTHAPVELKKFPDGT